MFTAIIGKIKNSKVNLRIKALWARQAETATFTIGAEAANVINVAVALKDANGTAVAAQQVVQAFLSDSATGVDITATAPDGGTAEGSSGFILVEDVAQTLMTVETNASGVVDVDITESGADTWYLVVALPNGKTVVSGAITFAA